MENASNRLHPLIHAADHWLVKVRIDDGTALAVAEESQPTWHAGQRVRLVNGSVMSM